MGGEVLDLEIVLLLYVLQENVDSLDRVDSMLLRDEARSVKCPGMDPLITRLDMWLEPGS